MLSAAHAIFAKCHKEKSIQRYTEHLKNHPKDYEALKWRGRALSIIGNTIEAHEDFDTAEKCIGPPYNALARTEIHFMKRETEQAIHLLLEITKQYPKCGEAWAELGSHHFNIEDYGRGLDLLAKAIELGEINRETDKPWHYWAKYKLAEIYLMKGDIDTSEQYYSSAIQFSPTFTNAHLGVAKCNVIKGNLSQAEGSYITARDLNPTIVPGKTFREFKDHVVSEYGAKSEFFLAKENKTNPEMMSASGKGRSSQGNRVVASSGKNNGAEGRNGKRPGSGSDDDDYNDEVLIIFKNTQSKRYKSTTNSRTYKNVGSSKFWLSPDMAGHADSYFKLFIETGSTLKFVGSVPKRIFKKSICRSKKQLHSKFEEGVEFEDFDLITNKWESHSGEQVKKKDLKLVQQKPNKKK